MQVYARGCGVTGCWCYHRSLGRHGHITSRALRTEPRHLARPPNRWRRCLQGRRQPSCDSSRCRARACAGRQRAAGHQPTETSPEPRAAVPHRWRWAVATRSHSSEPTQPGRLRPRGTYPVPLAYSTCGARAWPAPTATKRRAPWQKPKAWPRESDRREHAFCAQSAPLARALARLLRAIDPPAIYISAVN